MIEIKYTGDLRFGKGSNEPWRSLKSVCAGSQAC